MNSTVFHLVDFDRAFIHEVSLNIDKVRPIKNKYPKSTEEWQGVKAGFVKRFTIGYPVVVFECNGGSCLKINHIIDRRFRTCQITERKFLFLYIGKIKIKANIFWYFDVRLLAFLSKIFDPTYDGFDEMSDDFLRSVRHFSEQ